ncbi:ATP-binding protein [Actinophytocola xanthii]|uniref:histidine kinase n=1 Tax=Actinophytocola xanthii TaxID=1912961 RepID=A0A1Q8CKH3_9PSEU|nr:ATP-binding protein [Actinophytocola xanthii]
MLFLLAALVLTGGATLWVSLQVPAGDRLVVAVFGGTVSLALCVAVAVAAHRGRQARSARDEARKLEAEFAVLAEELLPAAARRLREGASADTVISEAPRQVSPVHRQILAMVAREISAGERRRAAAMAACASAAGRVQAMATSMLADLREMESRHSEEVLGDLLRLDHSTAQTGRLADSIAVLTGARSGRRWTKPIVMESILRGAMGRIGAYQRVRVHSASTAAIAGYAAEDVMHALAELMDNATRFSAPSEEVHVYVEELHTGVVVTIEDGGLGMKPQALERAEAAVSTSAALDIAKLSGTRLGLAVVGVLARKHQLHVFFRPSSRGGTGVVVRIPNQLIVHPRWDTTTTAPQPAIVEAPPVAQAEIAASAAVPAQGGGAATAVLDGDPRPVLPKRPRGHTLATSTRPAESAPPSPPRPRNDFGARFSAFRQGGRTGHHDDSGPSAPLEDESR